LENIGSKYPFAVCTHSGIAGATIENIDQLIKSRGGHLAGGFTVKMGNPYPTVEKLKHMLFHRDLETDILTDNEKQQSLFDNWKKKLEVILAYIDARKTGYFETRSVRDKFILAPFLALQNPGILSRYQRLSNASSSAFEDLIPMVDRSFQYEKKCNGCGLCARVCPVHNIGLTQDAFERRVT
jgi:ferredoxin